MEAGRSAAVFLDRDGTLNCPAGSDRYITEVADLILLDGAAEAVDVLRRAGFTIVVVSNQRGVARGLMTAQRLAELDARLRELVEIDAAYYCPHGYADACECRKPAPGMLLRAAAEHGLDLERSWMVGDAATDIEAGERAGCMTRRVAPVDGALLDAARAIVAAN